MISTVIFISLGVIIVIVVGFFIWMESQYKLRVTIKEITNNRKVIRQYRAKEFIDKDKVLWWKLAGEKLKERKVVPVPPESAIEIDNKGRKYAEGIRTSTGSVVWLEDNTGEGSLAKEMESIKNETKPITTNQRMLYLNNIRKAEDRNKNKDWKEIMLQMAPLGALVLILICMMVFWGEMAQPAINVQSMKASQLQIQKDTMQLLSDMKASVQTIDSRLTNIEQNTDIPD